VTSVLISENKSWLLAQYQLRFPNSLWTQMCVVQQRKACCLGSISLFNWQMQNTSQTKGR